MKHASLANPFLTALLIFYGLASAQPAAAETRLRILTGTPGGIFEPLGKAYSEMIGKYIPDTSAASEVTKGTVFNIFTLANREAQIGFAQADVVWEAYKGYGEFREKVPLRVLAVLYPNSLQLVATRESGIRTVKDLRGKRVSTNSPGTGGEIWALRMLAASSIDPDKDFQRQKLSVVEATAAMKAGKLDAFFFSGGAPAKAIADFAKDTGGGPLQLIDTAQAVPAMLRKHGPVYSDGVIPANAYTGQQEAVKVADVWNLIIVRADMDEKLAYDLVKTLFEHKSEFDNRADLAAVSKVLKQISLKDQAINSPIPFHAGAARYLKEKGIRLFR